MSQLSIIIPTKDRDIILSSTLLCAVNATRHIDVEIIVINDSKTTRPQIDLDDSNIRLLDNPKKGVASARNLGAMSATSDLLLFVDDDVQINKDVIDQTIELHSKNDTLVLNPDWVYPSVLRESLRSTAFGRFLMRYNFDTFKGWYNHSRWQDNSLFESPLVASFHLSISKHNFLKVEGYNEIFPHAGFEDYDFPVRLRKEGLKLMINTKALVHHNEDDRKELRSWLERQVRGSKTRRIGVEVGYPELTISYSPRKKTILRLLLSVKRPLIAMTDLIPNLRMFDFVYFRLTLTLQAICIFEGYQDYHEIT